MERESEQLAVTPVRGTGLMSKAKTEQLIGTDGRVISARALKRGLAINLLAGAVGVPWFAVVGGLAMPMFLERVGATGVLIGLSGLVMQMMMVVQIPATLFVERLHSRKLFWAITTMAYRPLLFVPIVAVWIMGPVPTVAWITIACVGVIFLLHNAGVPLWFGWMADLVPEEVRGRYWGKRHSICTAASLVMVIAVGPVLDAFRNHPGGGGLTGFALLFGIAAVLGTLDIIIHLWVPEPRPAVSRTTEGLLQRIARPLRSRNFTLLIGAMAARALAVGIVGPFGIIYLKQVFGASYTHLTILAVAGSVGGIVSGFIWGYVMDRIGPRVLGLMLLLVCPLPSLLWFFVADGDLVLWGIRLPQVIWLLLPGHLLGGMVFGGICICQNHLSATLAPRRSRTMAMAVLLTLAGVAAGIGSQAGGIIVDHVHPAWSLPSGHDGGFIHVLLMIHAFFNLFVAVPLLYLVRVRKGELPLGTAFRRLFLQNPVRLFSTFWNVYHLGAGVSATVRARAVAELGSRRSAIVVRDLVDRLDDPSGEVREQAALALGAIGSPDAVEALLEKLRDRETDLAPHIVRALRQSADGGMVDARGVDMLVARLDGADAELRREGARTLGAIGDRRAAPTLLAILRDEEDRGVVDASCEALARLGEIAAIYEIVPRMKATANPVLRRSLAVAVGDLLGGSHGFYPVLNRELATPGAAVVDLARRLRRSVEKVLPRDLAAHGRSLVDRIDGLIGGYEAGDHALVTEELFSIGIGLAALAYGVSHGDDAKAFIDELLWRDERFGVGMWYLDRLRQGWPALGGFAADEIDVLIGVHFLAWWASRNLGR